MGATSQLLVEVFVKAIYDLYLGSTPCNPVWPVYTHPSYRQETKSQIIMACRDMTGDPPPFSSLNCQSQESALCLPTSCVLTVLVAYSVNLEKKENAAAHHTSEFQTQKLVLRRGQIFNMKVVLNRPL